MTPRERFISTLRFGQPDRIPLAPGGGRESTRERWYREGLPHDVEDIAAYAYREAGGTLDWPAGGEGFHVNERMIPLFEEKVIERGEHSQVVQDWKGNICEISNVFSTEHLRNASDFVTRRWIKCPVETRKDWDDMQRRYDADDETRLPADAPLLGQRLAGREHVLQLGFSGPFWQLREWLGFENLCMMFHDDPNFVKEMIEFWRAYMARLLQRLFRFIVPDVIKISEDMAFKSFPMISPEMAREFLLPVYQCWGEIILGGGCPVYEIDSDGFVHDLIPVWMEGGVNACSPMEVAAGNDLVALRKEFGHDMAYTGGIDKRAMAKGGQTLEAEIHRLESVVRDGGYIPGCDHGVPSDVSWSNFVQHVGLLARSTGWL